MEKSTKTTPERAIRHILIALNSCSDAHSTIDVAVELAHRLEAELAGLFVEDINLLHLAELPFAHEILSTHLQKRMFDVAQLQRSMAREAERVRQALMQGAEQRRVNWSFLRAQGQLVAETVTATKSMDLLVVGRDCQGAIVGSPPDETVGKIVQQSSCSVLIAAHRNGKGHRAVDIIIDNSEAAMYALQSGLALAQMEHLPIRLLLVADSAERQEALKKRCRAQAAALQSAVTFDSMPNISAAIESLASGTPVLLVVGYESLVGNYVLFKQMFQFVSGPILIVR